MLDFVSYQHPEFPLLTSNIEKKFVKLWVKSKH